MIRRSSGRIRRLTGNSSCANAIFCPTSNGYRPPPFIRGLTTARSGIPSGRLMTRSANIHRPGDRWNCKCDLTATDEEPTPLPDEDDKNRPQPGLDNNPGTDGKLFSDNHPYQAEAHKGAKKAVDKLMARIDEMIAEMPDYLTGEVKKWPLPGTTSKWKRLLKSKKENLWMWIRRTNRMQIPNMWKSIFWIPKEYTAIKGEQIPEEQRLR